MDRVKINEVAEIFLSPLCREDLYGEAKLLKRSSIEDGKIIKEKLNNCSLENGIDSNKFLKKGDIVFQAKGITDKYAVLIDEDYDNLVSHRMFFNIRINSKKILPEYLEILLNSEEAKDYFESNSNGRVIRIVTNKTLGNFKIPLLEIEKQILIVKLFKKYKEEEKETLRYLKLKSKLMNRIISTILSGEEND